MEVFLLSHCHAAEYHCQSSAVVYLPTKVAEKGDWGKRRLRLFESARGGRVFKLPETSRNAGYPANGGTAVWLDHTASDRGPFLSPLRCWFVSALKSLAASCQSSSRFVWRQRKWTIWQRFRRIGRTYPGPPPEVVDLEIINVRSNQLRLFD